MKLVFRASDRRLLGAHILGEEATELIHIAHAMLHSGATVHEFIDTTFNFPTRADAYKYAAYDALGHLEARKPVLSTTSRVNAGEPVRTLHPSPIRPTRRPSRTGRRRNTPTRRAAS